ncbi:MAG: twin-arginine translocation signal domain-containing protein, partial [Rhodobacterales bacterium]|nr:twin-arginine translocation signal domain-containing protein [Rhodobacterales bacterium]
MQRRDFLKTSALATAALSLGACGDSDGKDTADT